MKKILAVLLLALPVLAEPTSEVNDPKPQHFVNGVYVGPFTGSNGASQGDGTVTSTTPLRVIGNASIAGDAGITGNLSVGYVGGGTPEVFWGFQGVTFSNATKLGGYALPGFGDGKTARAATLTALTGTMTTASAGTGAVTVTVTDGTNTCTATAACSVAASDAGFALTTPYRLPLINGAGTGCVYPAAAPLSASVTASNCGTTTPIGSMEVEGNWQ